MRYGEVAAAQRRPLDSDGGVGELIRLATLAANSHNTQPWRVTAGDGQLVLRPDPTRRCPVVDADDHHLWASLGCAVENAVQAAPELGLHATAAVTDAGVTLHLERAPAADQGASALIRRRQCTRTPYDGTALAAEELAALAAAGGDDGGVELRLLIDARDRAIALDAILEADRRQLTDAAFRRELFHWMRCTDGEALARRDGLAARVMGAPRLPRPLVRALLPVVLSAAGEAAKRRREMASSAGLAVFTGPAATPAGWIAVGRAYQRFALEATRRDLRHAFVNQPVEVAQIRPAFAAALGLGDRRPDLVVRFGRGPLAPYSLRRPVAEILTPAA
ncbi:MAG: Tat pathway signal protein [Alphaproteobacteria bacterium]|nr:Tat pathway signal protein [Alphaproteobacteria bacterium]